MPIVNTFANSPLDRAGHLRKDEAWIAQALKDPSTSFIPFWKLQPFVVMNGPEAELGWLRPGLLDELIRRGAPTIFLGLKEGRAHFAVDISRISDPRTEGPLAGLGDFVDLRQFATESASEDVAIMAQAKSLLTWHDTHKYCAACGAPSEILEAGHVRYCQSCGASHFPRTDPVVIMLATRGEKCLVGRQSRFRPNSYSALAGFVEPGETIEEAVRREVYEETAISVGDVRYVSSQPWPYPMSLMIGCVADAETEEITIDGEELEEARWVDREEARLAIERDPAAPIAFPGPVAIAHHIIKHWVYGGEKDGLPL